MDTAIAFVLGVLAAAGVLVPALLRLRRSSMESSASAETAARQLSDLRQSSTRDADELRFLTHFLGDYPRLAHSLHSGLSERQVPPALVAVLRRSLEPSQVAVLVRRGGGKAQPRLVVAAVHPAGGAVEMGTVVPLDSGEIGFAAETQTVVSRADLTEQMVSARLRPGLPGMAAPDLIAPMVFDQETLGVIVVAGPTPAEDAKAALRLVAQSGALALHTAGEVSRMRVTAEMDGLTRIYNKEHMDGVLTDLVYRAASNAYDRRAAGAGAPTPALSVFMLDIDNFKNYNDTNGHLAGDELLQELARLIQDNIRKDDVFGRFGGEEFLVVLPHTNAAQALAAAEKLRAVVADHAFAFADSQPLRRVSISGGVAEYPHDGRDGTALLRAADQALYDAKHQGRNRVLAAARPAPGRSPAAPGSLAAIEHRPDPALTRSA